MAGVALVTRTMTPKSFLLDHGHPDTWQETPYELGNHYYTQAFVCLVVRELGATSQAGF